MVNLAVVVGRVAVDPELKKLPTGESIVTAKVAVERKRKTADELKKVDYINVTFMDAQADFEEAPTKDCLYRTNAKINGKFGRTKGYLYTEIIKYSDLLKRARRRNQVFTDLLFGKENSENKANN